MAKYVAIRDGGKTTEEGAQRLIRQLLSSQGVLSSDYLKVTQRGAGANKSVDVAIGDAVIFVSNYLYHIWSTATENIVISDNASGNPRITAVVAYVDLTVLSTATNNNDGALKFLAVDGTPAASPTAPSDPTIQTAVGGSNPFIRLANVNVANGFTQILNSDVVDSRTLAQLSSLSASAPSSYNLLKNGNFINASTNGYGGTPDDWTDTSANAIQGGFPSLSKQNLIDLVGVIDSEIKGLYNLNGNFSDLSTNGYTLTASGSPSDTFTSLMAQAKQFASASSQYATGSAVNAKMTGSQTWYVLVTPTTIGAQQNLCGFAEAGATNLKGFYINSAGRPIFTLEGLTTSTVVTAHTTLKAGKTYLIVGRYNGGSLDIWVNGVKTTAVATGSASAGVSNNLSVGRIGDIASNYSNSVIHGFGIIGKALTDGEVSRIWAFTSYKGVKVRRSGTDATLSQSLSQDLVERLRGKTVTFRVTFWQDTSSIAQIEVSDGTVSTSTVSTTTGSFVTAYVTKTISSTAQYITLNLKAITTNGNVWFKEVGLYESSLAMPYTHSADDWSRFPRLLKFDPPAVVDGYQYEQYRWFSYTPYTSTGWTSPTYNETKFMNEDKSTAFKIDITGTSNATGATFGLPARCGSSSAYAEKFAIPHTEDNGVVQTTLGVLVITGGDILGTAYKTANSGVWTGSGNKRVIVNGRMEAA